MTYSKSGAKARFEFEQVNQSLRFEEVKSEFVLENSQRIQRYIFLIQNKLLFMLFLLYINIFVISCYSFCDKKKKKKTNTKVDTPLNNWEDVEIRIFTEDRAAVVVCVSPRNCICLVITDTVGYYKDTLKKEDERKKKGHFLPPSSLPSLSPFLFPLPLSSPFLSPLPPSPSPHSSPLVPLS